MTSESPEKWWAELPAERKATIHRWLAGGDHPPAVQIQGQISIEDFLDDDEDQPIGYTLTDKECPDAE